MTSNPGMGTAKENSHSELQPQILDLGVYFDLHFQPIVKSHISWISGKSCTYGRNNYLTHGIGRQEEKKPVIPSSPESSTSFHTMTLSTNPLTQDLGTVFLTIAPIEL